MRLGGLAVGNLPAGTARDRPVVAVPVTVQVMVVPRRRGRHIVATVGQMGRVLHAHLVAMVVRHVPLGGLHQRRLDVRHELGHDDEAHLALTTYFRIDLNLIFLFCGNWIQR